MIVTRHRNTYNKHYKPKKNFLKGKIHEKPEKPQKTGFLRFWAGRSAVTKSEKSKKLLEILFYAI